MACEANDKAITFDISAPHSVIPERRVTGGRVMELRLLHGFLSIATTCSFSRAADDRHVTKPAVIRRIGSIEAWVGTTLVDRSTYPTMLTPAGHIFRDAAEDVLRRLATARRYIAALRSGRGSAQRDFETGQLVRAGGPKWDAALQLSPFWNVDRLRRDANAIWQQGMNPGERWHNLSRTMRPTI